MRRLLLSAGLLAGLTLLLSLLGTTPTVAEVEQAAISRLTIYVSSCPPGYAGAAYYQDCGANALSDVAFTVYGGDGPASTATTDGDGVAAVEGFAGGPYPRAVFVEAAAPLDLAGFAVFCYDEAGALPVTYGGTGITLEAADGYVQVHCDWFVVPAGGDPGPEPPSDSDDGLLTVHVWACTAGFDWEDFESCKDVPLSGVVLHVVGETGASDATGPTDFDGAITFPLAPEDLPGSIGLRQELPAGFPDYAVICVDDLGKPVDFVETDVGAITILDIAGGEPIACDWFDIAWDQQTDGGSVAIRFALCPPGYTGQSYAKDCQQVPAAAPTFYADSGESATPDANGLAVFPTLRGRLTIYEGATGDYRAVAVCSDGPDLLTFESAGTGEVTLDVAAGDDIICDWYHINPVVRSDDGDGAQTVVRLPDTGTAAGTVETAPGADALLILLPLLGLVTILGLFACERRTGR